MTALMILGMHRSYTSLTAQWLLQSGLHLGANLLGASVGNEDGHFEDLDFVALHEDILGANALPRDGLRFENDRAFDFAGFANISVKANARVRAAQLIASRPAQFGWKDPRTCLMLELWRAVLPDAASLVLVRHFDSVVRSLDLRDRALLRQGTFNHQLRARYRGRLKSFDAYLGAWIHYNRCLVDHVRRADCLVVTDLAEQAHTTARWLADRGFNLRQVPLGDVARPLPPQTAEAQSYPYNPLLYAEARALLANLCELQGAGNPD